MTTIRERKTSVAKKILKLLESLEDDIYYVDGIRLDSWHCTIKGELKRGRGVYIDLRVK